MDAFIHYWKYLLIVRTKQCTRNDNFGEVMKATIELVHFHLVSTHWLLIRLTT